MLYIHTNFVQEVDYGRLNVSLRRRLLKSYAKSVTLYGADIVWTTGCRETNYLESYEIQTWRSTDMIDMIKYETELEYQRKNKFIKIY